MNGLTFVHHMIVQGIGYLGGRTMWIVYYYEDSADTGFIVENRQKAIEYCLEHTNYRYVYIG